MHVLLVNSGLIFGILVAFGLTCTSLVIALMVYVIKEAKREEREERIAAGRAAELAATERLTKSFTANGDGEKKLMN